MKISKRFWMAIGLSFSAACAADTGDASIENEDVAPYEEEADDLTSPRYTAAQLSRARAIQTSVFLTEIGAIVERQTTSTPAQVSDRTLEQVQDAMSQCGFRESSSHRAAYLTMGSQSATELTANGWSDVSWSSSPRQVRLSNRGATVVLQGPATCRSRMRSLELTFGLDIFNRPGASIVPRPSSRRALAVFVDGAGKRIPVQLSYSLATTAFRSQSMTLPDGNLLDNEDVQTLNHDFATRLQNAVQTSQEQYSRQHTPNGRDFEHKYRPNPTLQFEGGHLYWSSLRNDFAELEFVEYVQSNARPFSQYGVTPTGERSIAFSGPAAELILQTMKESGIAEANGLLRVQSSRQANSAVRTQTLSCREESANVSCEASVSYGTQ